MTTQPTTNANRHAVYTGRSTSWPMVTAASASALAMVLLGRESGSAWADARFVIPLVLVAIAVLSYILSASSVRTTAGPNGLTIRWGLIGWPKSTYSLDQIEHAEVIDLPWWRASYGFWWTPTRTNCTVQSGPTLQLTLTNGRTVRLSVPQPAAAVAILQEAAGNATGRAAQ